MMILLVMMLREEMRKQQSIAPAAT